MPIKKIAALCGGLLLFSTGSAQASCSSPLRYNGEEPSYTPAYIERDRYKGELGRREASPAKFQWLRNPAANNYAYDLSLESLLSIYKYRYRHCIVAMATKDYREYYSISGKFPLYQPTRVTMDTSEFLYEFRRDAYNIRNLVRQLDGSYSVSSREKRYLVDHHPRAFSQAQGGIKITYLGTSTMMFEDGATRILIDGFFSRPDAAKLALGKNLSGGYETDTAYDWLDWGGSKSGKALDAIVPMHAHHDHIQDIPAILERLQEDGASTRYLGGSSARNMMRGYAEAEMGDRHALDSFITSRDDDGFRKKPYRIGDFKVHLLKTSHATVPSIIEDALGLGQHQTSVVRPPWRLKHYKEGDGYSVLIKHPKGNFLIWLGGEILHKKPLKRRGKPISIDTMFVTAGGSKSGWDNIGEFVDKRVVPHKAKRVIPVHWDNQFNVGDNDYFSSKYRNGIENLAQIMRSRVQDARLLIAPVNTYWYEDHSP